VGNPAIPYIFRAANLAVQDLFLIFCLDRYLAFLERATCSVFGRWSLIFFQVFFAVLNIGRVYNGQKIKGVVKQCIDWVDTLIARKSIMLDVV